MQHLATLLILTGLIVTGALALSGGALARDMKLTKTSADALKAACVKAGGEYSTGPRGYGCGTNCNGGPGTDCIVHCVDGKKCTAQVIGGRRPHTIAQALTRR
jgi:hypothetical protein